MSEQYRQVTCSRSVTGGAFASGGQQNFKFHVSDSKRFVPSKSFFKIDYTLTCNPLSGGAKTDLPQSDTLTAPAELMGACLYEQAALQAGGSDISSLQNNVPQASALRNRLAKQHGWQKSLGQAFGVEASFQKRIGWVSKTADPLQEDSFERVSLLAKTTDAASVFITAVGDALTGVDTDFTQCKDGDIIVIAGVQYYITVTDATTGTVKRVDGVTIAADVAATAIFHGLRRVAGEGKNVSSTMWQPPLGIFNSGNAELFGGDFTIVLNPSSDFQTRAVESLQTQSAGARYELVINDVRFYACIRNSSSREEKSEQVLSLVEQSMYAKQMSNSSEILDFTVPSSTSMISVFLQDATAGKDVQFPPTRFVCANGVERNLKSIQVTKDGISKPPIKYDSAYNATTDQLYQRFVDTQLESGSFFEGGESYREWLQRGVLLHFNFDGDVSERGTSCQVSIDLSSISGNPNCMVCAWYDSKVTIQSSYGRIEAVTREAK